MAVMTVLILVVKTLKFWANGGQIGGQFNILKYKNHINQLFKEKKKAHRGGAVGWGKRAVQIDHKFRGRDLL